MQVCCGAFAEGKLCRFCIGNVDSIILRKNMYLKLSTQMLADIVFHSESCGLKELGVIRM